jgi:NAD(P)H-flavin reductase
MTTMGSERQSPYLPESAELLEVQELAEKEKLFRICLSDGRPLGHTPGQFVEVSIFGIGEAPISIASSPTRDGGFDIVARAVGTVTQGLHHLQPGDTVGIRGPFGNGFPVPRLTGHDLLFVAGGIGLSPLRSMIQYAIDRRQEFGRIVILYGCREPAEQLFRKELAEWRQRVDMEFKESVDRCPLDVTWEGSVGVITTLFPQIEIDTLRTFALIIGPPVMFRYVVAECLKRGMAEEQILLSLERRMKCGMGFCGHCQINNTYVCLEGPVFSYAELSKLREVEV